MSRLIANTKGMLKLEWLLLRKQGIGGSDASAVAGINKYTSPILVYLDKLDLYVPIKKDNVHEAAHFGNVLEPVVRKEFIRRVNIDRAEQGKPPLKVTQRNAIFAHTELDFMRTNLDGIVYDPEMGKGVFEAKTAHYMLRDEWAGDDVPDQYFIQCQHNMAVMGYDYAYLAVLIGGNTFKYYYIPRDEQMIETLIALETNFWNNHILQRIPPQMTGHDAEKEMLNSQYPDSEHREGYIVNLPDSTILLAEQIEAIKAVINTLKTEQQRNENELKAILGDTESAFAGMHKVSWKTAINGTKTLRIKLDAANEKQKYYDDRYKLHVAEFKRLEKETLSFQKEGAKIRKAITKANKLAEKAVLAAIKEQEKKRKIAEKETQLAQMDAELINSSIISIEIDTVH